MPTDLFSLRPGFRRGALLGLSLLALTLTVAAADLGLPEKSPAAAGMSATRLTRLPELLQREIAAQHYAGAVWLVARDGGVVSHGAVGVRDATTKVPMSEDTEFRIFSMSKLVTTVTALTLVEEGRINLDDPVERYLPALAHRQVLTGGTADQPQLEPAARSITIRHLLTQTSGIPYDIFASGALRTIWEKAGPWQAHSLQDFVNRLAPLPLAHQPGTKWTYGFNTDVLGAVIEAVTGQDLETAMRERVFSKLGMTHTTFHPDAALRAKLATIHHRTPAGGLAPDEYWTKLGTLDFASGGGGLFSTLPDYARFGQMLLNDGELDGVRVLGRKTVEMMRSNQIGALPDGGAWTPPGFGFGVRVALADTATQRTIASPGSFGWEGIASTLVLIDPKERVLLLVLLQHTPFNEDGIFERATNTAYSALEK